MHLTHTPPASTTELLDVLALFPKCTACGAPLSVAEPVIPDPEHAFRMRHARPCEPAPPPTPVA
jgi:hypothetical protein